MVKMETEAREKLRKIYIKNGTECPVCRHFIAPGRDGRIRCTAKHGTQRSVHEAHGVTATYRCLKWEHEGGKKKGVIDFFARMLRQTIK